MLDLIDKGVSQETIVGKFYVAKSTVGKICKLGAQYRRLWTTMKGNENYEVQIMGMSMA